MNRIKKFEKINGILIPEQFRFVENKSTAQQLFRVTNYITTNLNLNKSTALVMLDIENAFDTVCYEGLIYKLSEL